MQFAAKPGVGRSSAVCFLARLFEDLQQDCSRLHHLHHLQEAVGAGHKVLVVRIDPAGHNRAEPGHIGLEPVEVARTDWAVADHKLVDLVFVRMTDSAAGRIAVDHTVAGHRAGRRAERESEQGGLLHTAEETGHIVPGPGRTVAAEEVDRTAVVEEVGHIAVVEVDHIVVAEQVVRTDLAAADHMAAVVAVLGR